MPTGRPLQPLALTEDERSELESLARRRTVSRQVSERARIVLMCARGLSNGLVAERLSIHQVTVGKWRERFRVDRLAGLTDAPRSGTPRRLSDERIVEIVERTVSTKPKSATHWSSRSMESETGLSRSSIQRIWHAYGLQPHRSETFKLSTDPFFVEKTRDVVGLYLSPPDNAIVLCVDEKSQVQALDRTQRMFPMRPGIPERQTHDYRRHGVTSLFAALNIESGKIIASCHRRHRHQEFLRFLRKIDAEVPSAFDIHLVLDNYATHKHATIKRWLLRHPRFQLHFTPTSASWLNQVERFFAEITRKRIRRGTFTSVPDLERAIREYIDDHNGGAKPFAWTATADLILGRIESFCQRTSGSQH
jgi:transposase